MPPGSRSTRISAGADVAAIDAGRATVARVLRIPPERAADAIVKGVRRRHPRVLIGATAWLPDLLVRVLPGSYSRVLNRLGGSRLRIGGP